MKTSSALAVAMVLVLSMKTAVGSWGHLGGLDSFHRRYPPIDRDWSGSRRPVRHPQQHTGWPWQQRSHGHRDPSPKIPKAPLPPFPSMTQADPNDDFTAAFLSYAGEDVVLSSLELSDLVHAATAEVAPPSRRSVLQILRQWDSNRDGGLNLSEFMKMYAELQRQMPSTFQQHWDNLRVSAAANTAPNTAREQPLQPAHEKQPPTHSPISQATLGTVKKIDPDPSANDGTRPRKGRLNYIEKGERFFELVFDDEDHENGDGPLTVQTVVSTRIVGEVDSWAESDVW